MAKKINAAVRVRMYRHGLGDCFLLSFPRQGKRDFRVLIDCGIIQGTPAVDGEKVDALQKVVADLKKATTDGDKPAIDVLVATHEHWDHLAGFAQLTAEFDQFDFKQVWLAWTEDPKDPVAKQLRKERAEKVKALKLGLDRARQEFRASGALGADGEGGEAGDLARVAEVLSFFGVDPAKGTGLGVTGADDDLFGVKGKPKLSVGEAMDWCRKHKNVRFFKPGGKDGVIDLTDEVDGLRVYVLGPPTNPKQLFKDLPTKKGRETYEEEEHALAAVSQMFFGADVGQDDAPGSGVQFDRSAPFDPKYKITMDAAAGLEFFRTYYFGTGCGAGEEWRRIDGAGLAGAAAFALKLDSDTNNTSLALAFELGEPGKGRVLLFPGDAQVGNWESWHDDVDGLGPKDPPKVRTWTTKEGVTVTAKDLLERTVLYKCGHHGSHNATLRGKGLELMTHPDLVALVPVDVFVAHEKKHWDRMPFIPLMDALRRRAKRRVVVADRPVKELPKGLFDPDVAYDSDPADDFKVLVGDDEVAARPLYFEYVLRRE